tara:strand:+ start:16879 stop:17163 length:285 start_codon:yes stop_codon:yes gene_type:complete
MKKWEKGYLKHIETSIKIIENLKDNWVFLDESDLVGSEPLLNKSDYTDQINDEMSEEMSEKIDLKSCLICDEISQLLYKIKLHKLDFLEDTKEK